MNECELHISVEASDDVYQIMRYLGEHASDDLALDFHDKFRDGLRKLKQEPKIGKFRFPQSRKYKNVRTIELKRFKNHLILYTFDDREVRILAVQHSARNLPSTLRDRV